MRNILLIFSILIIGCTKVHDLEKKNGIYYIKDIKTEIKEVKHINWDVGLKREIEVSKGMRLSITVPIISDKVKNILHAKHGIDAWVYRFSRIRRGRKDPLGFTYYHFNNISRSTKAFMLNIYYHAASVSNHFRNFHCPAFDHRFYIPEINLIERQVNDDSSVYVRSMPNVKAKVDKLGFMPLIFTAGRSMVGEYQIDYALYNTKTKQRYSSWLPVQNKVSIPQELHKSVASCTGIKEELNPLPSSKPLDIRSLEIK